MLTKTLLALGGFAMLAGTTLPAPAETDTNQDSLFGTGDYLSQTYGHDTVIANLRYHGVDAVAVEQWGPLIRAYVRLPDGRQVQRFYTPHTLEPADGLQ